MDGHIVVVYVVGQPGLTPYRAHVYERYYSIESCPRARYSDFFGSTERNVNQCILNRVFLQRTLTLTPNSNLNP